MNERTKYAQEDIDIILPIADAITALQAASMRLTEAGATDIQVEIQRQAYNDGYKNVIEYQIPMTAEEIANAESRERVNKENRRRAFEQLKKEFGE